VGERLAGSKYGFAVRAHIERQDAARARTMRAFFGTEQEDASLYHVVLNTDLLSIDDCVNTVSDLAETPRFRNTEAIRSALANHAEHLPRTRPPI
jgi:cytidylate kinase